MYAMINAHQFLGKETSVTIHTWNPKYLETEIFQVKIGISPAFVNVIFKFCNNAAHNLRIGQVLERRHILM